MTRRYYVPDLIRGGGTVTLTGAEAHHAIHVMRVEVGDSVELFDGKGSQSQAVVTKLSRSECDCKAEPAQLIDREPSRAVHLGIALPKPDRARELVERLTELGVKTVTPLVAERTQRPASEAQLEKLRRGVIEACKQSGRNELLRITEPQPAKDYFAVAHNTVRLIAHPSSDAISLSQIPAAAEVKAAIGPEGGWTDDEVRIAIEHGFESVDLGRRIYRIETAATVVASVLAM